MRGAVRGGAGRRCAKRRLWRSCCARGAAGVCWARCMEALKLRFRAGARRGAAVAGTAALRLAWLKFTFSTKQQLLFARAPAWASADLRTCGGA